MKVSDVLVGAGFLVGATIGLAAFVVKTTVKIGTKAVSTLPKSLTELPSRMTHSRDQSGRKQRKNSVNKKYKINRKADKKGGHTKELPSPGLSPDKAQQLADSLSTKPSIDKEEEKHPYSATLKNPSGFRPSGAGGNAV